MSMAEPSPQCDEAATGFAVEGTLITQCPVLETERLILRPPNQHDVDDMVRLANNPQVALMLTSMPYPYFRADAEEFLASLAYRHAESVYAITLGEGGTFMGICSLHAAKAPFELSYAGYWLGEEFWGRGYASEATRALVDLFFKVTGYDQMQISCAPENRNSRRVIEKCGGKYWKQGEVFSRSANEVRKIDHYQITRVSWMEAIAA